MTAVARETPHLHRCTKCHGIDASVGPDGFCALGEIDCDGSDSGMFLCLVSAVDDLFCGGHYERILPEQRRETDPVFLDGWWRRLHRAAHPGPALRTCPGCGGTFDVERDGHTCTGSRDG